MESKRNQDTYGRYLREFRIKQELSIEAVAKTTRISAHCLRAMEDNGHDRLPPRTYVQSFIRTYASAVGADADVAMALYQADLAQQENTKQQHLKRLAKLGTLRRTLTAFGLILIVLLLVRFSDLFFDPAPYREPATTKRTTLPGPSVARGGNETRQQPDMAVGKKLKLQVVAVEQTWLKVIVDDQNARSYDLKPEDRIELEGSTNFNLMIGNATGLKIFLNDDPVKIFGSNGQVVSLKIP